MPSNHLLWHFLFQLLDSFQLIILLISIPSYKEIISVPNLLIRNYFMILFQRLKGISGKSQNDICFNRRAFYAM